MRRFTWVFLGVLLLTGLPMVGGQGQPPKHKETPKKKKEVTELMKKKLLNSQKVLEGIALGDFKLISKHAEELLAVSKDAEWRVLKTPEYEIFSNEFRRNAETLIKTANDKNLDGGALAYVEMTLNCVKCHKYVRERRMTWLDSKQRDSFALRP